MSAILIICFTYTYTCTEHPFRTRMPLQDEPYTEQVIILPSQGIWYRHFSVLSQKYREKLIFD